MQNILKTVICVICVFAPLSGYANLQKYCAQRYMPCKDDSFLKNFDFKKYLSEVPFSDLDRLQRDRLYLYHHKGDGDDFLYQLAEQFVVLFPVGNTYNQLKAKIEIGEKYLVAEPTQYRSANEIYRVIGYHILGQVAIKIEELIKTNHLSVNQLADLIQRLANNKVFVRIEKTNIEKLVENIRSGRVDYIFSRSKSLIMDRLLVPLGEYFREHLSADFFSRHYGQDIKVDRGRRGRLYLRHRQLYFCDQVTCAMELYRIYDRERPSRAGVGQAIYLKRASVDAKYFAKSDPPVPEGFRRWARNQRVMLATAGGFTNIDGYPEGLTVDKGEIVNAVLMHDRHGLILVEKTGGIRVINLKRSQIALPGQGVINNPLASIVGYSKLLKWCKLTKATLFQTQLLAFSNELLIDPSRAKTQTRERRLLALLLDKKSNELVHVLLNFPNPNKYALAEIAKEVWQLTRHTWKLEALINLDVGTYDILHLYDEQKRVLPYPKGPRQLDIATNLLAYSRK